MAFWRSSSSFGASWPWIAPPMQRIAAAVMMPSGVPPIPASRSVPLLGRHAEIGRASCRESVDLGGRRILKKKKEKKKKKKTTIKHKMKTIYLIREIV